MSNSYYLLTVYINTYFWVCMRQWVCTDAMDLFLYMYVCAFTCPSFHVCMYSVCVSVWVYANTCLRIYHNAANDLELAVSWGFMKGGGWCVHVCIEDVCVCVCACAFAYARAVQWLWSTTSGLTFEAHLPGARIPEHVDRIHIAISFSFQMYGPSCFMYH